MTLGRRLRSARNKKGLSQRALADQINTDQPRIAEIERGVNLNPTLDTLRLLAEALEVTIGYLVGEESTEDQEEVLFTPLSASTVERSHAQRETLL